MDSDSSGLFREFRQEAEKMGVCLDPSQMEQFRSYLHELREWNAVTRLVSKDDPQAVVWAHFMDSLTPLPYLDRKRPLLDIGSGAGFPGVPLKIACPGLPLHVLDSQRRRVHFLKHLVRRLDLAGVTVHLGRMEAFTPPVPFRTIISRALASPQRWLPWACRVLEEEGRIILMLGRIKERGSLDPVLEKLRLCLQAHASFGLPVIGHQRHILVLGKTPSFT